MTLLTLGSNAKSAGEEKNIASIIISTATIAAIKAHPIHSSLPCEALPGAANAHRVRKASRSQ
jgi:hypothetical protein